VTAVHDPAALLQVGREVAREAADLIVAMRHEGVDVAATKTSATDVVTRADRASEDLIRQRLLERRPGDGFLGEEGHDEAGSTGVRWIVDPIDGTRNYVRGVPIWATLLALEREGRLDAAVVSAPALGRRWWAARGEGAYAGGDRIRVSAVDRLEDCVASTSEWHEMPAGWAEVASRAWVSRGFGDFWQHCLVAEGAVDVAAEPSLQIWDYSAVQLLVEEAGGRCSTFENGAPAPAASFLATNGTLHETAVAILTGTDPSRAPLER
jgi:histidinol-phosphatase